MEGVASSGRRTPAVAVRELVEHADDYTPGVRDVPDALDRGVVEIWLDAESVETDSLTDVQTAYVDF